MKLPAIDHTFPARSRRGSTRTVGLAASALTAAAAVALVGFFYLRGRTGPAPVIARGPVVPGQAPPDIRAGTPGQAIGASKGMHITLVDKRDPTRIDKEIITASSEPQENAWYLVEKPQAFIYSRNGVVWHVRADKGRMYIPNSQMQPEAATLEGNVVVRAFDEPAAGKKVDPDAPDAHPLVVFNTSTIEYDGTLGDVSTTDPFKVVTEQSVFTAIGLRARYDQDNSRLTYCEFEREGELHYRTGGKDPLAPKQDKPRQQAAGRRPAKPGEPAGAPAAAPRQPLETFYHAVLSGGVTVTRGSQSIVSDSLESWMHMVDNELRRDAITPAPRRPGEGHEVGGSDTPAEPAPAAAAEAPGGPGTPALAHGPHQTEAPGPAIASAALPDEIVLKWGGNMVIQIEEKKPEELTRDEVAVRFTTAPDTLCRFNDTGGGGATAKRGTHGTATTIEYGATSQVLKMASLMPDGVVLSADGSGNAIAQSLTIDMGSGLTTIEGPGSLRDRVDRYITWSERAEFQFHIGAGGMTDLVETASASGQVEAVQGAARLRGSELTAGFLVGPSRSDVFKLLVRGGAQAADGRGGELSADLLDVSFGDAAAKAGPPPELIDARGNVLGQKDGTSLAAQTLHVQLTADENNQPVASSITASGGVKFVKAEEKPDGRMNVINAASEEITADVDAQMVELTGPGSMIGNSTSKVYGAVIRVDGSRRYVDVFGQGRFEHQGAAIDSEGTSDALVTWTRHLAYDDVMGLVECEGNVVASNQPDAVTVQTLRADHAKLMLEPRPDGAAIDERGNNRRLQQAFAWGIAGATPRPAQVEMRVYDSPSAVGRERPVRVSFLEGGYIIADDDCGTLDVPGPGRMYFSDRRPKIDTPASEARVIAADAAESANPFSGKAKRGDARFIWNDWMNIDRRLGTITISGKSNLRHVRLADGLPTDIEADSLIGRFQNIQVSQAEKADAELHAEFLGADAVGNVWMRSSDNKELVADRVEYDAEAGIAKAIANEGNSVVFFDPAQGVPQRAKVLFWDRTNNRIEIRDAGTVVVPR